MIELIDVVHQTAENGLSPKEDQDIFMIFSKWLIIFSRNVFYYFCICILFNQKLYVVHTFFTLLCTCLDKILHRINYNNNSETNRSHQDWISTDLIYFQILIVVLLFVILMEYEIQELWTKNQERTLRFLYEDYE